MKKEISTFSLIDKDERYNESENINELVSDLNIKSNLINLTNNKNDFFHEDLLTYKNSQHVQYC